jgi:c-di-GMP-binding flagellar brake protein YcgR
MYFNLQKIFLVKLQPISDSLSAYEQFAESIRESMSKNFSVQTIFIFVSIVLLFVLAVVFFEIYRSNKAKEGLLDLAWKKFDARAEFLKLNQATIDLLKKIVEESSLQDPSSIIKSPHVFEKSLEIYYENKKIKSMPDSKLASIRNLRKILGFLPLSKDMAFISTRQFEVGEKCAVQIPENGPATHKGMCLIKDVEESHWSITSLSGPLVPVKTWILVNLIRAGDAEYTFRAQVLETADGDIVLAHTNKLNRAQQRNWVRIDVSIPVEVTQIIGNGIGDIFSGKIIDMSGGGFGMALPVKLPKNSKLLLNFELPGHGTISDLPVKVVRVAGNFNNDPLRTVHSVAFDSEIHLIQEQIIQYVFEKQRQDSLVKQQG